MKTPNWYAGEVQPSVHELDIEIEIEQDLGDDGLAVCCGNCRFWDGIDELGSYIEGICHHPIADDDCKTGYMEHCPDFTQTPKNR